MTLLHRLRRPAVLAAVGALLAPLALGTGAGAAVADPGEPLLAVGSFAVTEGASAASGAPDPDGAYASDLAYDGRASSDGVVVEAEASFACASETDHCEDAEALVSLAQMTLAAPVELNGLEVAPRVEYFADAAGTVPAASAAGAAAFRLTFREPTDGAPGLRAGTTGWLSLRAVLAPPADKGRQDGSVTIEPWSAGGAGQPSRVRVGYDFPVALATGTTLTWSKDGYLSGIRSGADEPVNRATVAATLTGDPARDLTVTWGDATRPVAGTVGMVNALTDVAVTRWPANAASVRVEGWTWDGAAAVQGPLDLGTVGRPDDTTTPTALLAGAGVDDPTRDGLTALRLVFRAADGTYLAHGDGAELSVGVRELGSQDGVPVLRTGARATYAQGVSAADLSTLAVEAAAGSSAARGTATSTPATATQGFRVYDPRAYAGSSTRLEGVSGTVYGGGYVRATAGATSWTRLPLGSLALTVRPTAADVAATNEVLTTDVPGLDADVLAPAGLAFAGFGAGRAADGSPDGTGATLTGFPDGAELTLRLTVMTEHGATSATRALVAGGALPALPTDPAELGVGSWAEVRDVTAELTDADGAAAIPLGAGFTVPYLLRAKTLDEARTYVAHTLATATLADGNRSSAAPRTAQSGNRPVTAASVRVLVPTVGVAGEKIVVERYAGTTAGRTTTAVLSVGARQGASGHWPDTLIAEDSARLAGARGWWDALEPVAVSFPGATDGGAPVTSTVQYTTAADPAESDWADVADPGDLAAGPGADPGTWTGLRVVSVRADGQPFASAVTVHARVVFAVRDGAGWDAGDTLTNVARFTGLATVEGFPVTATVDRSAGVVGVLPHDDPDGSGTPGSGDGPLAMVKTLSDRTPVEGTGTTSVATLTWGTDGRDDLSRVTVTDAGTAAGGGVATDRSGSFWDTVDLQGVRRITSGPAPDGSAAWDPYLVFDRVADVRVYDALDPQPGWHSLLTEQLTDAGWVPGTAGRTDLSWGGSDFVGQFPGVTFGAGLRARVAGVQLVYEPRTDRAAIALEPGDWRAALAGSVPAGAVAPTDGPARQVLLDVALRDVSRTDPTLPVNDAHGYTDGVATVVNEAGVVGTDGEGDHDLLGAANDPGQATLTLQPGRVGATITKTWSRDENGQHLADNAYLGVLALPVDHEQAAAADWPTATLTLTARSTSTTRVDRLTVSEPARLADGGALTAADPFASFAITDVVRLTVPSGATATDVVLHRADGSTESVSVGTALGLREADLATVVGIEVRHTGRILADSDTVLELRTRLLPENRVSHAPTAAGQEIANAAAVRVSDARVCAVERQPFSQDDCVPAVARDDDDAELSVAAPALEAFAQLAVTPSGLRRDAADPRVTATMSVQNFGLSPAEQLLVTNADPRFFNAVGIRTVTVGALPSGSDRAQLEVLLRPDVTIAGTSGGGVAYAGDQQWVTWGAARASGDWVLEDLARAQGLAAADVVGVRVRFLHAAGQLIPAPGQGFGRVVLTGALRDELVSGGLPSAVGADGWQYAGAPERVLNPGESARGVVNDTVVAQALRSGVDSTPQSTNPAPVTVSAGTASLQVQKTELDVAQRAPGQLVQYRIRVQNTAPTTTGADVTGLVITDRLPEDGSLVYGDAPEGQAPYVVQGTGAAALGTPVVTTPEGAVVLTFGADTRLAPGQAVEVLLWLRVAQDLSSTTVVNSAAVASVSRPVAGAAGTAGAGVTCASGTYVAASRSCTVQAAALGIGGANVYVSEEWVRDASGASTATRTATTPGGPTTCTPRGTGTADRDWYRYPCAVVSAAGSRTQWQVQVNSRATIATDRLEMITMLPAAGDYPAMNGSGSASRGSQWRPVWDGVVPDLAAVAGLPRGATLAVRTTTADYRAGGVPASADFDPVPGTWSTQALTPGTTVPAAQAARVTGFKLEVTFPDDKLSTGEAVRVQWGMRTPLTGVAATADTWSSFAYRVPADPLNGRASDVTSVPLKAGARFALAADTGRPPVALGDRVWLDRRSTDDARVANGLQDAAEEGVAGVLVDVFDVGGGTPQWVAEATTRADGWWVVDGLPAGTYQVRFTLTPEQAARYRFTTADAGDDALDSDAVVDSADGSSAVVTTVELDPATAVPTAAMPAGWPNAGLVTAAYVSPTWDAGLQWRPVAVGDRVWLDTDRDGVQDAGEPAAAGVPVALLDADDRVVAETVTGASGGYRFDGLDPGTYRVEFRVPDALADRWTFTATGAGLDPAADSDAAPDSARLARTAPFALAPGDPAQSVAALTGPVWAGADADYADATRDAGLRELPVSVGDRVWVDTDGDGVQDDGEPGLADVWLRLTGTDGSAVTDAAGGPVADVRTDADGGYAFTGLVPGAYTVHLDAARSADVLAPYDATVAGAGDDPARDSATDEATTAEPLTGGRSDTTLDFGFRPRVALGDRVWLDADRDGVQDDGEPGVDGIGVAVYADGDPDAAWSGSTSGGGLWLTGPLPAGRYRVELALTPEQAARYRFTGLAGGAADVDSDAVPAADGSTGTIAVAVADAADPGTVATSVLPAAWRDAHPGLSATFVALGWDAGLQWRPLAVGDRVWFDADRDGVQGEGEQPAGGVPVALLDAGDAVVAEAVTDEAGAYRFDGLDPGTYRVEVRVPDALAGRWELTTPGAGDAATGSDAVPETALVGRTAPFALAPGDPDQAVSLLAGDPVWDAADADYADPTWDAGLRERPVSVGDRVWADTDGDGLQDAGEPGLEGVWLTLTDAAGDPVADVHGTAVGPVRTGPDGAYAFAGLLPGAYTVRVDAVASAAVLAPYEPTAAGAGDDPALDSAGARASTDGPLLGGEHDATLDFGFRPLLALGDRVWLDADRDGVQDVGEPGLAGATVRVLGAGGGWAVAETVTDADGVWRVDGLSQGDYRVQVELAPADAARYGWTAPRAAAAPRADADSDVEDAGAPGLGETPVVRLDPAAPGLRAADPAEGLVALLIDPTWDAGLVERPVSVGHRVWFDADEDGVQDDGEPGLPGVVVELRTPDGHEVVALDGTVVAPVTTDADGRYAFTGLAPGEYRVRIDRIASGAALAGYAPTIEGAGDDPALDSATWAADSRVLVGGEQDTTLDFGLVLADDVQLALRKVAVARTATTVTWDVTVASTGTQDAYAGFTVVDTLPAGLTYVSAAGDGFGCTVSGQVVTCAHDGPLAAGESATVRVVTALVSPGAEVANTATVDVTGRGYRFEVLAADDVAWSDPAPVPAADGASGSLATTGSSPAVPFAAAALLVLLGAALSALPVRRRRSAGL